MGWQRCLQVFSGLLKLAWLCAGETPATVGQRRLSLLWGPRGRLGFQPSQAWPGCRADTQAERGLT